jgi:hypothetical protein
MSDVAQKRGADSLALLPQAKRNKNEVVAYTAKDKQLMELVIFRNVLIFLTRKNSSILIDM